MAEKNYDFRRRHWQYHRMGMRQSDRTVKSSEVCLDGSWKIGCPADAEYITRFAVKDFQDYLEPSMEYVCDKWHLEWKIRQVNSAIDEIKAYRKMLFLHTQE